MIGPRGVCEPLGIISEILTAWYEICNATLVYVFQLLVFLDVFSVQYSCCICALGSDWERDSVGSLLLSRMSRKVGYTLNCLHGLIYVSIHGRRVSFLCGTGIGRLPFAHDVGHSENDHEL